MGIIRKLVILGVAIGSGYVGCRIGKALADSPESNGLEKAVCEEIDTQAVYDRGKQIAIQDIQNGKTFTIWDGYPASFYAEVGPDNMPGSADGIVDSICEIALNDNSTMCYERSESFSDNEELFLWADQKLKEETQRFSQYSGY